MGVLIFALILLAAGALAGWRLTRASLPKKLLDTNSFLEKHSNDMRETVKYWQEQSAYKKQVENLAISSHTSQVEQTLKLVLSLLDNLQKQERDNLKKEDSEKISSLIRNIKGISS